MGYEWIAGEGVNWVLHSGQMGFWRSHCQMHSLWNMCLGSQGRQAMSRLERDTQRGMHSLRRLIIKMFNSLSDVSRNRRIDLVKNQNLSNYA